MENCGRFEPYCEMTFLPNILSEIFKGFPYFPDGPLCKDTGELLQKF